MDLYINDLLYAVFDKNGCGPDRFNCWQLCREIYRRAERSLPDYNKWIEDIFDRDRFIGLIKKTDFLPVERPGMLDIVTLKLKGNLITHCGCMLDKRRFIHISKKKGVSISDINDKKWRKRIEGFYRFHG